MKKPFKSLPLLLLASLATACSHPPSNSVYTEGATAGKVLEGKIISMRNVTIKANSKLEDNKLGGLGGAAIGGAAGSSIGNGSGSLVTAVGGAIIGAVGGAMLQDELGTSEGVEYLVKLDKQYLEQYHSISKKVQSNGKQTVEQDMTSAELPTKTDIVSIAQEADAKLHVGSPVYVIYNDDRPRLTAK